MGNSRPIGSSKALNGRNLVDMYPIPIFPNALESRAPKLSQNFWNRIRTSEVVPVRFFILKSISKKIIALLYTLQLGVEYAMCPLCLM